MVRTRRSIEEEARVRWIDDPLVDPIVRDPELVESLDRELINRVVKWGAGKGKRALVVGLEDGGDLAIQLLQNGMFVTVVDPSQEAVATLRQKADARKVSLGLNTFVDSYMKRTFSISSFDLVCIYSALNRFSEPFVVVRKAKREMKVGALFFGRLNVRPEVGLDQVTGKLPPKIKGLFAALGEKAKGIPIVSIISRWPTFEEALEAFKKEFSVQEVLQLHPLINYAILSTGALGLDMPERVMKGFRKVEERLPQNLTKRLGGSIAVFASKERELGRTFSAGRR